MKFRCFQYERFTIPRRSGDVDIEYRISKFTSFVLRGLSLHALIAPTIAVNYLPDADTLKFCLKCCVLGKQEDSFYFDPIFAGLCLGRFNDKDRHG